ncbi:hypothetical protein HE1_00766 [Holospora elegans E1]|uniref:Uncharacterized protein n=1 Tax=Holospora elegans E1 TaxID=1427503 RepID=A0A023E0C6_9PROT|nr:hypothetical protein [Holospora elegans]GAJ46432.1 hypothetical protein HE1_00766 [Holospora elegans E1]
MRLIFKVCLPHIQAIVLLIVVFLVQIPFAPLAWNFFYIFSVGLSQCFCKEKLISIMLTWVLFGIIGWSWICPISPRILSSPCGGYFWGIIPVLLWTNYCCKKEISSWIKWLGALFFLEICGAVHCILLSPNLCVARKFGLLALFPWNFFQSVLGIAFDGFFRRMLNKFFSYNKYIDH